MTIASPARLGAAAALLAVLVAAAAWVTLRDRSDTVESPLLYPAFAAALSTAERVELRTAGNVVAVELVRSGERWSIFQRDGYPADVGKIGVLLQDIAELEVIEPKTADPANYAAVGVEDVAAAAATGVRVRVTGAAGAPLVDLIVGEAAAGMEATYVRKADEAGSWLVGRLSVSRQPGAWIAPLVLHVDTDRVHEARLQPADRTATVLTRPTRMTSDFKATGRPLASPSAANGIAAGLIAIEARDVRRAEALAAVTPAVTATYRTFDGLVLSFRGWQLDGEYWIAVEAAFDEALAARFANDKPPNETVAAFWRTPEQARQEAERLVARTAGWAYRVQDFKYDALFPDVERWRR